MMIFRVSDLYYPSFLLIVFRSNSCLIINEGNARNCLHRFPAIWSDRKELEANLSLPSRKFLARNLFRVFFSLIL